MKILIDVSILRGVYNMENKMYEHLNTAYDPCFSEDAQALLDANLDLLGWDLR